MFASLSSFLPSALQQAPQSPRPPDSSPPPIPTPEVHIVDPPRKKDKKEKHATEAFIIVRPPPSKSGQPLSLQVQLVPPQSRNDRPVQALESPPDDNGTDLRRTHSVRSEQSSASGYNSAGSTSSFASTSTASSGRRTIIPLYNLNVHSVMPTTILDAGTDARVAKFTKRGLEIIGLGFLEPIEVRPSVPAHGSSALPFNNLRASLDDPLHEFGSPRSLSPNFPNINNPSDNSKPTMNLIITPPLPPPDCQPQRSSKKLFARVFKKKEVPSPITLPLLDDSTPQSTLPYNITLRPDEAPVLLPDTPHLDVWPSPLTGTTSHAAVLGVYPALYPPVSNPKDRPTKYVWVVRRWLKGAETSILNGMMMGRFSNGARDTNSPNAPLIEVRFEWSRDQKKTSTRKSRSEKGPNRRESPSPVPRGTQNNILPRVASPSLAPDTNGHRSSVISHNSSGSDTAASLPSCSAHQDVESGEESDPEDSETPWTCVVVVQRLGQVPQHQQNSGRESCIRIKAATLAPTPHHPKVVGLLKMPFPLPDIEIEHLAVRPRHVTAQGIGKTTTTAGDFVLTAEEIKDTVSSTAIWLVVREAFGGVGRERRKGKS